VPVKVLRDGKEMNMDITVKELPGSEEMAKGNANGGESSDALNGVGVADIDGRAKEQMNLPANIKGAMVTNVDQDSAAFEAGLRPGDVILEINRKPVQTANDAVKLTENLKDKKILLKVWTGGSGNGISGSHYLVVDENKAG
jgi:serine protease Do